MEIKAVFFDIDGTYFDHDSNRVLPETKEAVIALKKRGYKVALCSGRALCMAQKIPVFDDIEWDGFIGGGGNFVYDKHMNCIWKHTFEDDDLKQVFAIAKKSNLALYVTGEEIFLNRELNEQELELLSIFHMDIPEHVHDFRGEEVHMLSMLGGAGYDYSIFDGIPHIQLQPSCAEITDLILEDGNKAVGISHLLDHLGIEQGAYLAFGDNLNDAEMLSQAAIGVAMGNCTPQLKDYADMVCAPCYEPGIAQTLKKLQLI